MDRGAWWATGHGFAELDTTEQVALFGPIVSCLIGQGLWLAEVDWPSNL